MGGIPGALGRAEVASPPYTKLHGPTKPHKGNRPRGGRHPGDHQAVASRPTRHTWWHGPIKNYFSNEEIKVNWISPVSSMPSGPR